MMNNLFSIFDPSTSMNLSLNWMSMIIIFFIFPYQFWFTPSRLLIFWHILIFYLIKEFKILMTYSFSNLICFMSLFFLIFINNFSGLFPYIFTSTSHMSFCFSLSLSLWLSMMIFTWLNYFNEMLMHLLPLNTPLTLMPFMIIIEFISLLIRPLTLSIRLTANMITGHLLLTLINSSPLLFKIPIFPIIMFSQLILMILELMISFIQAYVFSILITLYSSEI